jgi:hypothetical protein
MTTRGSRRGSRHGEERSALAPREWYNSQREQQPSGRQKPEPPPFFDKSSADYNHAAPESYNRDSRDQSQKTNFELMDTTIIVYGLSGIMCEEELTKPKTPTRFGRSKDSSRSSQIRSLDSRNWSASTVSSMDISARMEGMLIENDLNPTTALVSLTTHTLSSDTAFETFLPSIPLHRPSISGLKAKYTALWSAFMDDDSSREQSSFELVRCMQESNNENAVGNLGSKYVHETVELQLSLSRGTEMILLGTASLVLSGEEEVEVKMNIPTKRTEHKQASKQKLKTKGRRANKYGYFSDDVTRRYFLDENATFRIGVQAISQAAKEMAAEQEKIREKMEREKKRKEDQEPNRLKELRERMQRVTMENTKRRLQMDRQIVFSEADNESEKPRGHRKQRQTTGPSQSFLPPNLLCSMPGMLCSPQPRPVATAKRRNTQQPIDAVTLPDDYGYHSMESVVSSVSYSTYESESDSEWESGIESYYSDQGYSF